MNHALLVVELAGVGEGGYVAVGISVAVAVALDFIICFATLRTG